MGEAEIGSATTTAPSGAYHQRLSNGTEAPMHRSPRVLGQVRSWVEPFLLFVAVTCAFPASAMAQTPDDAETASSPDAETKSTVKELMHTGIAAYRKKDFEAARAAFAKAWRLKPHSDIAAALADVEMKLGRYRDAAGHWDYYLNYHPPDLDEAQAQLAECRKYVASVRVDVRPPEADVVVDGMRVSALAREGALWLEPGHHTLVARYDGRSSPEQKVEVAAGGDQTVRLEVAPPAPATPAAVLAPAPPPPHAVLQNDKSAEGIQGRTIVLISGATLTAAATAVGIVSLVRASSAGTTRDSLAREIRAETPATIPDDSICAGESASAKCSELAQKADEKVSAQNLAIGSFVAGGVFGVATIVTYVLWPTEQHHASARGLVVAPLAERGSHGLQVRMEF